MLEPRGFKRSTLLQDPKTRYFIITSNIGEHVVKSVEHSVWATQRKNEQKLNDAFRTSTAVILVFSVNKSGAFQGYARMRSLTGRATCRGDPFNGFGRLFDVEWLRLHDIDVAEVNYLRNPLDESRQVGFSRDGQELAHSVGAELCRHFDVQIYREDPSSFEPVTDVRPTLIRETPPKAAQLALPPPTGSPVSQQSSFQGVQTSGGCTALATIPSQATSAAPLTAPAAHLGPPYAYGPVVGHPHHYSHPAGCHGPYMTPPPGHFGTPGYPHHAYGPPPPPWTLPQPHTVYITDPYGRRRRARRRRRRRDSSYSYDSDVERKDKEKKKKRKKVSAEGKGSRQKKEPDFLNMSYDDYMKWWHEKHSLAAAGGPHGVSEPTTPAGKDNAAELGVSAGDVSPVQAVQLAGSLDAGKAEDMPENGAAKAQQGSDAAPAPSHSSPIKVAAVDIKARGSTRAPDDVPPGVEGRRRCEEAHEQKEGGKDKDGDAADCAASEASTPSADSDLPEWAPMEDEMEEQVPSGVYQ
mmetsp:Transcript_62694/g.123959  ORF Transcript_62694/g.123959 Transcript_62694/m.123959 type:complete len:523 (-) Transcript_62694:73-1641(-)